MLGIPLPGWSIPAVITYAYCNADALAKKFRATCQEAFGTRSVSLGQDPETAAYLLALKRHGLTYAQVFERCRCDHADRFPWTPDDPEYEQKREETVDTIKKPPGQSRAELSQFPVVVLAASARPLLLSGLLSYRLFRYREYH